MLHRSDKVVQAEDQREEGDCAELGNKVQGRWAIDEEHNGGRLLREVGVCTGCCFRLPKRPSVEDHDGRVWLLQGVPVEPYPHIDVDDAVARIRQQQAYQLADASILRADEHVRLRSSREARDQRRFLVATYTNRLTNRGEQYMC